MSSKNSICIKCKNLVCNTTVSVKTSIGVFLVSCCKYDRRNTGIRKTCKRFSKADDATIAKRINAIERKDNK